MNVLDTLKQQQEQLTSLKRGSSANTGQLISAVHVPIEVEYKGKTVRLYVVVAPETVSDATTLKAVLDELSSNFDIAAWRKTGDQNGFKRRQY